MWERLQRFSALEPPARRFFLRASALLPLVSLSLRFYGFGKTQALLQRFLAATDKTKNPYSPGFPALVARMVRAAGYHGLGHPTCLAESLALWWLLGREGIVSDLRVGVRKDGPKFEAHAWVECEGAVLNEPEARHLHFAAFDAALASLPPVPR